MSIKINHSQTTHRGNHREQNEDSCAIHETRNGQLFVTCDGMGGAAEGKKASSIGVKSIVEFFEKEEFDNIQIALFQSLKFANEQIYATAQLNPAFKGMGTTACVVLFQKDEMYFAHVGDSRIYLHTDGKLKHLTRDHSFVNQLVDQGTLRPNEAKNHPEKNRILKALGVHLDLEPTVANQPVLLKKGDQVLLCSDGLTDMVSDPGIEAVLNQEKSVPEKTQTLLQKALDNGGKDNITVQLIEVAQSPHTTTVFADKTPKDLSTTLIDADGAVNQRKSKFSKNYLLLYVPVLLLLIWSMVSIFNDKKELEVPETGNELKPMGPPTADSIPKENGTKVSITKTDSILNEKRDSQIKEKKEEREVLNEEVENENKPMPNIPDYVIINASAPEISENIFPSVTSISQKYGITEAQISAINKTEPKDYKAGDKVFLSREAYDKFFGTNRPNNNNSVVLNTPKDDGEETEKENNRIKKWTTQHDSIRVTGEVNEKEGTIKAACQAPSVSGQKIGELLRINGRISQDDFNKLKVIYLNEKAFKKTHDRKEQK